ncbi:MFS transporter [Paucibacter sp. APW11]|uniref:MFS transporter n=1 Tax=Roseateles aquae TaxID=3077235 RepID=A0ABU3PCV5_9BURK|nr:MFS transporter [Paucibacter sp. APW11]MDT9000398.1 MFS transporter [Paucibacter sp. APW11]
MSGGLASLATPDPGRSAQRTLRFLLVEGLASMSISTLVFALDVWVYQRTGSYALFAALALLSALPGVCVSPLIGPLLDKLPRGLLVQGCSLAALLLAALALLWQRAFDFDVPLASLLVLTLALIQTVRWPTLLATVSSLSPAAQMARITGYEEAIEAGVGVAAPLLAVALLTHAGLQALLGLMLLAFAASLVNVARLELPRQISSTALLQLLRGYRSNFRAELNFGFVWIRQQRLLFRLLIFVGMLNFGATIFTTMQTPLALTMHGSGAIAQIMACGGIGLFLGGICSGILGQRAALIPTLYIGATGIALSIALYALGQQAGTLSLAAALFSFFHPPVNAAMQILWRQRTPIERQGAIFAVRRTFASALGPLAITLSVPLAQQICAPLLAHLDALGLQTTWAHPDTAALGASLLLLSLAMMIVVLLFAGRRLLRD